MQVHLDTDYGGDPDDACALALLLGWPDVEVVGITTNLDEGGRRAGCVAHHLGLADRTTIPVAAGAGATLGGRRHASTWGDPAHWPDPVAPRPSAPGAAVDLLAASITAGATVVAIGALTNLALLETAAPGTLDGAEVVVMGGWLVPPAPGLPPWGPETDWNLQCDTAAAVIVARSGASITWVTLPAAFAAHLRRCDLPRLADAGPFGTSLAGQSEAHGLASGFAALAAAHDGLPDDLVNVHWDPVTAAVALGWDGVDVVDVQVAPVVDGGVLRLVASADARPSRAVVAVEGAAFSRLFLEVVAPSAGGSAALGTVKKRC